MRNTPMVVVECDGCGRETMIEVEEGFSDTDSQITVRLKEVGWSVNERGDFCRDCPGEWEVE